MFKKLLHSKFLNKEIVLLFFLYVTLIISLIFGENSTGGAIIDYDNQKKISKEFSLSFFDTLYRYDDFSTRHSPVLIIILSFFEKLNFPDFLIRFIHLHFCLLLPFFFLRCLEIKFKNIDKNILYLLALLIFISPTFRSLSVWPDSRISGLIFFTLSIYYYLKFFYEKKFNYAILNTLSVVVSAYFSPNFSIFSLFFILNFISYYGFKSKEIFFIFILNSILAIPAFYYIFYLDINFLVKPAAIGITNNEKIIFNNLFNDVLITFSILFFYILPFIVTKIIKLEPILLKKNIILSIIIFLICVFNFNYNFSYTGGGIFFQVSNLILKNNYLFYFIGMLSIIICLPLLTKNKFNILIFLLILLNNPQYTVYHKYFDPFFLIIFFTILDLNLDIKKMSFIKKYLIVFFYFFCFLIISNIKYLWKI